MTSPVNESIDEPNANPRADLLYLLQKFSRVVEVRDCRAGVESAVSDEQMAENKTGGIQV